MVAGEYSPGFRIALHHKDLGTCENMVSEKSMPLTVVASTRGSYQKLIEEGHGDDGI